MPGHMSAACTTRHPRPDPRSRKQSPAPKGRWQRTGGIGGCGAPPDACEAGVLISSRSCSPEEVAGASAAPLGAEGSDDVALGAVEPSIALKT